MTSDQLKHLSRSVPNKAVTRLAVTRAQNGLTLTIPSISISASGMSELRIPSHSRAPVVSPNDTIQSPSLYYSTNNDSNQRNRFDSSSFSSVRDLDTDPIEEATSFEHVSTSAILRYCKLKVLRPYFRLLSLMGWRPLIWQATLYENKLWVRFINCFYASLIITTILLGYTLQYSCCYRQDGYKPYASSTRLEPVIISTTMTPELLFSLTGHKKLHREGHVMFRDEPPEKETQDNEKLDNEGEKVISSNLEKEVNSTTLANLGRFNLSTHLRNEETEAAPTTALKAVWPSVWRVIFPPTQDHGNFSILLTPRKEDSEETTRKPPKSNNPPVIVTDSLKCRGNFFALYLFPNCLHFLAYLFMLYLMRTPESERLENLMERGFLQTTRTTGWVMAHRKLINSLRSFLWLCLVWLLLSLTIHTLMVGSRVYYNTLDFRWMTPPNSLFVFVTVLTVASMTYNDLICGSIATSYAVHCQLNISYIINLCASIRERRVDFQEFYKRIEESRKFIEYLNHDQALGISLLQITVGCKLSVGIYALLASSEFNSWTSITIVVVLLSLTFWASIFTVPLVQAVRLTTACLELKKIGHELRARPFGYQDAKQEDLDSLILYTTNLCMEAKILFIPVKSSCILIICVLFITALVMLGQLGLLNF